MFKDEVDLKLNGGKGGDGRVSFYPKLKSGPDGGSGGNGGNLYLKVSSDLSLLSQFTPGQTIQAENGEMGGPNQKTGRSGKDIEVLLPAGIVITDKNHNQKWELNKVGESLLFAKGGRGGKGNFELRSPRNTTPKVAEKGHLGEERSIHITLKLIADFGLIGMPNSGKSSLLNGLTSAKVKVGNYPFTTLEPNLGVLKGKIIADIPGLIEGASFGKGLGIRFLKHIEKVAVLLHCISAESPNPLADYEIVISEIKKYNPTLARKNQIILLTKSDLLTTAEITEKLKVLRSSQKKVLSISIFDDISLEELKKSMLAML